MAKKKDVAEIRRLNDELRTAGKGGRVVLTLGIQELGEQLLSKVLAAVASFDAFNKENDPYGEYDCAIIEVEDLRVLFKIDYYNRTLEQGSENPADPSITTRVLTVMLASEY